MSKNDATAVNERAPLFEANWTLANQETQATQNGDFVLNDGTTSAGFTQMVGDLGALIELVNTDAGDLTLLRAQVEALRAATHATMDNWRKKAASDVGGTPYGANLPTLPGMTEALASFLKTLRVANDRWIQINGAGSEVPHFTPPMIVKSTTQMQFQASIDALEAKGKQLETAENTLPGERARRDEAANLVYATETAYRKKVIADFPADSPALMTLPTLQPRDTGHTPDAVVATAIYDPATGVAFVNWTPSTDADFDHYSVNLASGMKYKSADAVTIGTLTDIGAESFTIPPQFLQPGATVWVAVDVVLTDYRHAQSNAVKFEVPV